MIHPPLPDPSVEPVLIPLRFPPPQRFAVLRSLLLSQGFTAEGVTDRTGAPSIYAFQALAHGRKEGRELDTGLDVLIRLFLDVEEVPRSTVDALLGPDAAPLLEEFGLLRVGLEGDQLEGSVLLYPTAGPWVVSDRMLSPDPDASRDGFTLDAVYPAITRSAMVFLSTLPDRRCRSFLELCSGTGIAALLAARESADEAVAVDITERSTVFARFNAALNGLDNVTALQGNLWEPVEGTTFDCIAAHPPYMAARRQKFIYRDGGEDGEQITRQILAGAGRHLAPGGVLHCTCMLTDRAGSSLAERVREMLGPQSDELDLLILENNRVDPWSHLTSRLTRAVGDQVGETVEQIQAFRELKVEGMVFSTVVVRRHDGTRPPVTLVRVRGPGTRWPQLEWALELGARLSDPERGVAWVAGGSPRLSSEARLHIRYRAAPGAEEPWAPEAGYLQVTHPFVKGGDATMAVARFLGLCDGETSLRTHLERMRQAEEVPPDLPEEQFVGMVRGLIEMGMLELDDLPVPPRPPERAGATVME